MSRELDAQIAKRVMGLNVRKDRGDYFFSASNSRVPEYSIDAESALGVMETVGRVWRGFEFLVMWSAQSKQWGAGWFEWGNGGPEGRAAHYGHSIPEAICVAALKTVEASKDE